jgi:hypothetical protein
MCAICEEMLYEEHRQSEAGPFDPCPQCRRFASSEGGLCYHCFSVGNTISECPECCGKPWSTGKQGVLKSIKGNAVMLTVMTGASGSA